MDQRHARRRKENSLIELSAGTKKQSEQMRKKSSKNKVTHSDFSLKNRIALRDLRYFGEIVGLPPPPRLTLQLVPHRRERLIGETDDESRREQSH